MDDKLKWDKKYKGDDFPSEKLPNRFLVDYIHLLPKGRVLDIAAGKGRNSIFLARHGFQVEALDISELGLKKAEEWAWDERVEIKTINADLEGFQIEKDAYDAIINFYYLQRDLIFQIKEGLKKGGVIMFETYIIDQLALPSGPKNRDYLLGHNELLSFFNDFRVIFYREGIYSEREREMAVASIIATK